MTLLLMDGFGDYPAGWENARGYIYVSNARVPGRWGDASGGIHTYEQILRAPFAGYSGDTLYCGIAMRMGDTSRGTYNIAVLESGGSPLHVNIAYGTDGYLRAYCGSTLVATSSVAYAVGWWHHFSIYVKVADSGGRIRVTANSESTPAIDYTGDTRNGGSGYANSVYILVGRNGAADDFWVDTTTDHGDCRVYHLVPNGAGSSTQFTPSTGSNYQCVDELPTNTTDYVYDSTPGHVDLYTMSDLPAISGNVKAVQALAWMAKSDSGARSGKVVLKSGATTDEGPECFVSTSYLVSSKLYETDPNTGLAWTVGAVNALECGAKVQS